MPGLAEKGGLGASATCQLWGKVPPILPSRQSLGNLSSSGPSSRHERLYRQLSPAPHMGYSRLPVSPEPLIHGNMGGSHECHSHPQVEGGSGHVGTLAPSRHRPSERPQVAHLHHQISTSHTHTQSAPQHSWPVTSTSWPSSSEGSTGSLL